MTLPFFAAKPMGYAFGAIWRIPFLPLHSVFGPPPITADQVESLKGDNVVADDALTLKDLGITSLESVEAIVPTYLWRYRPYGEFHQKGEA